MKAEALPYVFYNARWGGYVMLILSLVPISVVVYGGAKGNGSEMDFIWLLFIAAVFFWLGWKNINDKAPALKFGPDGIWTPKLGLISWSKVFIRFERTPTYKSGSVEYLMISTRQTRKHLDSVALTTLKGPSDELKELLQQHMLQ